MPSFNFQEQRVLPKLTLRSTFSTEKIGLESNKLIPPHFLSGSRPVTDKNDSNIAILTSLNGSGCYLYDLKSDQLISSWSAPINTVLSCLPCMITYPSKNIESQETNPNSELDSSIDFGGLIYSSILFSEGEEKKRSSKSAHKALDFNKNEIWAWDYTPISNTSDSDAQDSISAKYVWGPITDPSKYVADITPLLPIDDIQSYISILHSDGSISILNNTLSSIITSWQPVINKKSITKVIWSNSSHIDNSVKDVFIAYILESKATSRSKPTFTFRLMAINRRMNDISFTIITERLLDEVAISRSLARYIDKDVDNGLKKKSKHEFELDSAISFDYNHNSRTLSIFNDQFISLISFKVSADLDNYVSIKYSSKSNQIEDIFRVGPKKVVSKFIGDSHIAFAVPDVSSSSFTINIYDTKFGSLQSSLSILAPSGETGSNSVNDLFITLDTLESKSIGTALLATISELIKSSTIIDYKSNTSIIPYASQSTLLIDAINKVKCESSFLNKNPKVTMKRATQSISSSDGSVDVTLPGMFTIATSSPVIVKDDKYPWNKWSRQIGTNDLKAKHWLLSVSESKITSESLDDKFKAYINHLPKDGFNAENEISSVFIDVLLQIIYGDITKQNSLWPRDTIIFLIKNNYLKDSSIITKTIDTALSKKDCYILFLLLKGDFILSENTLTKIIKWTISGTEFTKVDEIKKSLEDFNKSKENHLNEVIDQSYLLMSVFDSIRNDSEIIPVLRKSLVSEEVSFILKWISELFEINTDEDNGVIVPLTEPKEDKNIAKFLRIFKIIIDASFNIIMQSHDLDKLILNIGQKILDDVSLIGALQLRVLGALNNVVPEALEEQRISKELLKATSSSKSNGGEHGVRYRRMLRDIQGEDYQIERYNLF